MLTILILAGVYLGIRAVLSRAMRSLPHSNDDMIFY